MTGELWLAQLEIGKETTYGTAVAGTRKMYGMDVSFTRERDARPYQFMTGSRDNVRGMTLGPVSAGGSLDIPMSSDELLEALLCTIQGGVTPTTPGGATNTRLWTYKPSSTLDSATLRYKDGAQVFIMSGVYGDSLSIEGSVGGDNKVSWGLFARDMVLGALTGSLTERLPTYMDGWQTKMYIDNFGAAPGTTVIAGTLINWKVNLSNNLDRKYTADNTLAANKVTQGLIDITADLTFEAVTATAATEFANWDAQTKRLVRLEFQDETAFIEGAFRRFVTVDIPGAWSAVDITGDDANTRTYQLSLQYVYDPTNAFGLQIRCQNARTAAYA
jgi:hypothetical protein